MSEQHYQIPSLDRDKNIKELETLNIGDRVVYLWMKTHIDYKTSECFPSYKEIANEINKTSAICSSPCTENFVKVAIKRLESVGWIKVKRNPGSSNTYTFLKYEHFEKFYKDFLDKDLLTWKEKDFYIQLQQYIFVTAEEAYFTWDYSKIAIALRLSYPTVKRYIIALKNKHVFSTTITTMRNQETKLPIIKTTVNLEAIGQEALIKVVAQTVEDVQKLKDKVSIISENTTEEINILKDQVKTLTEEINKLKTYKNV